MKAFRLWAAVAISGTTLALSATVLAQQQEGRLALSNPAAFREAFTTAPASTTRSARAAETLVGLRMGHSEAAFDANAVRVALGGRAASGQLCVRIIARDGRYSAVATYLPETKTISPAIEAPTRYARELREYKAGDLAVAAFVAPNCEMGRAGELFAALVGKPGKTEELVVQINAPSSRMRAQLLRGVTPLADPVLCQQLAQAPRIGFTGECRLTISGQIAGAYRLVLSETTSTGAAQVRSFPLRLVTDLGL